mmetsp:Transcript_107534/g.213562  ORF Transcript_107534/g.213562 Transcript_107534/m.213562 type:complete len:845 (-) Transcript_107534:128-2662(-)
MHQTSSAGHFQLPRLGDTEIALAHTNEDIVPEHTGEVPITDSELMTRLNEILQRRPEWVRSTIFGFLNNEVQRSYSNVAQQIRIFKECLTDMVKLEESEEAQRVKRTLRELKDSAIRALERDASNIDADANHMVSCIQNHDFESLKQFARTIEKKAKRFTEKFKDLHELLLKLAEDADKLQTRFKEGKEQSLRLKEETEKRCDDWLLFFKCVSIFVGVAAAASLGFSVKMLLAASSKAAAASASAESCKAAAADLLSKAAALQTQANALSLHAAAGGVSANTATVAGATSGVAAGVASFAAVGAPPATLFGSTTLGELAVSYGVMAAPAAPLLVVAGIGVVVALAVAGGLGLGAATGLAAASTASASTASTASTCAAQATMFNSQAAVMTAKIGPLLATAAQSAATAALCYNIAISTTLILALFVLGYVGRDVLASLLKRLWTAEIAQHEKAADAFKQMEERMQETADWLRSLANCSEKLIEAVEEVQAKAQELQEKADDTEDMYPPEGPEAATSFSEHMGGLSVIVHDLREESLNLMPALQLMKNQVENLALMPDLSGTRPGDYQGALSEMPGQGSLGEEFVLGDGGGEGSGSSGRFQWVRGSAPSASPDDHGDTSASQAATEPAMHSTHCLLSDAYVLVPITAASGMGRFTAAGPHGARACMVRPQGQQERDIVTIQTNSGETSVTASHRLAVRRRGTWTVVEVDGVLPQDVVRTMQSEEQVLNVSSMIRSTPAFELEVHDDGEVFIWTCSRSTGGHWQGASLAVLGRESKRENRSQSAPPRLCDLPSEGSRFHPMDGSPCGSICRRAQRPGGCRDGRYCRFCHFDHEGQSRRGQRGARVLR